ncbi:hypothetical protein ACQKLP_00435 [Chitinophaga sp. NPDC101104]|uniref:hypothetical protein n=1 Tax=Chitinophaga sp. NPDC101104 TaxID=3390561 RepID=UPI003CFFD703
MKVQSVTESYYGMTTVRTYDKKGLLISSGDPEGDSSGSITRYIYVQKGDTLFCGNPANGPVPGRPYYVFSRKGRLLECGSTEVAAWLHRFPEFDTTLFVRHIKRSFRYDKHGRITSQQVFQNTDHKLVEYLEGNVPQPALALIQEYFYTYGKKGKLLLRKESIGNPMWLKVDSFYYGRNGQISRIVQWQDEGLIGCMLERNIRTEWLMRGNGNVRTVIETSMFERGELFIINEETTQETYLRPGGLLTGITSIRKDGTTIEQRTLKYTFYP